MCPPSVDTCALNDSSFSCDEESTYRDLFEKKGSILEIHLFSYFSKSIKNIGLGEDCANYPIVDINLTLLKKDDPLGKDNLDLLDYLRRSTSDGPYDDGLHCDSLYDTPPLLNSCNDLSYNHIDVSGDLCQIGYYSLRRRRRVTLV